MLLTPSQARQLLHHAREHAYAVLAVNADSPAAITDCLEAARESASPLILEASLWQLKGHSFGAGDAILGLARYILNVAVLAQSSRYASVPVLFHTDHIKGPETRSILKAAIDGVRTNLCGTEVCLRASSISLDSSQLSESENIEMACELCQAGNRRGEKVTLEMEAGVDEGLTQPDVTENLLGAVEQRHPGHLALWAPGLGTRHGLTRDGYPAFSPSHVKAQAQLAARILQRPIGIALHGSSGLSDDALMAAVAGGVTKVNWSSESLLIRSQAARHYFASRAAKLEPEHPEFKETAMDNGVQRFVSEIYTEKIRHRLAVLGSSGRTPQLQTLFNSAPAHSTGAGS